MEKEEDRPLYSSEVRDSYPLENLDGHLEDSSESLVTDRVRKTARLRLKDILIFIFIPVGFGALINSDIPTTSIYVFLLGYALILGSRYRHPVPAFIGSATAGVIISVWYYAVGSINVWAGDTRTGAYVWIIAIVSVFVAIWTAHVFRNLFRGIALADFVKRFEAVMVPVAIDDLGVRERIAKRVEDEPLDGGGNKYLSELVDEVSDSIRRLELPRLAVTREEIAGGRAVRIVAKPRCRECRGMGSVKCPDCAQDPERNPDMEEPVRDTWNTCTTCGDTGLVNCGCTETVTYFFPTRLPRGFIVKGNCGDEGPKQYSRIFSKFLAAPSKPALLISVSIVGLILGLAGVVYGIVEVVAVKGKIDLDIRLLFSLAGFIWFFGAAATLATSRIGWFIQGLVLLLIASGLLFLLIATPTGFYSILHSGLNLNEIIRVVLLGFATFGVIIITEKWFSMPVRASLKKDGQLIDAVQPFLVPPKVRALTLLHSKFVRLFVMLLFFTSIGWVVLGNLPGGGWLGIRGFVAETARNYDVALDMYEKAVDAAEDDDSRLRLTKASARVLAHIIRDGAYRLSVDGEDFEGSEELIDACRTIADYEPDEAGKWADVAPGLVLGCGDGFIAWRMWDEAGEVLDLLESRFGESEAAISAINRTWWHFSELQDVSIAESVATGPYQEGDEILHDYLKPAEGNKLIVMKLELVHVGRMSKNLPASCLMLVDSSNRRFAGMGIQDESEYRYRAASTSIYNRPIQTTMAEYLFPSKEFPGLSIGPDIYEASVVFEVPADEDHFVLKVDGAEAMDLHDI